MCECDEKYVSVAYTLLPGGVLHAQANCVSCGSGWAWDEQQPVVVADEPDTGEEV